MDESGDKASLLAMRRVIKDHPTRVVMVGPFPPPVHGMAAVNAAVRDQMYGADVEPVSINVAANNLDRSLWRRFGRLPKVLKGLWRLVKIPAARRGTLYMSVSGGWGQLYELAFLAAARYRGMRCYLHHHSYAYLDRPTTLTRALVAVAGADATHIVLAPGMATTLQSIYPKARRVVAISNAALLIRDVPAAVARSSLRMMGFISNISAEKGVFDFLDLVQAVEANGLKLRAKLAGPFQDAETERRVLDRLKELSSIEYVGPKYGDEKAAFFASIDILIFPTRYRNEAEPLTIYEAMLRGIPVLAYGRGSIPEILGDDAGLVVAPSAPFVPAVLAQLKEWLEAPQKFEAAARAARQRFVESRDVYCRRWMQLSRELAVGYSKDAIDKWI